ncbi:FAD-dependent oxidoreductase [Mucilaginibacter sp.]|jgi:protoporphyrinogen oxidase|uniref:FAD-dependent oxidoreductase n=1 Tax=Mucilaginibacter sp. TaxID=1882438 RepID=UPI0035670803
MKIAVIGAGPAGLTIAHQLTNKNIKVDIYETAPEVGGFAKSIELWGRKIEIGPHFFNVSKIRSVEKLVMGILKDKFSIYKRQTFILTNNKIFSYPPSPFNIIKQLSILGTVKVIWGFIKQSFITKQPDGTAETFIKIYLGDYLYAFFFESFCKKLWGLAGNQVSDVFAKSLISFNQGYSPHKIILNKLSNFRNGAYDETYIHPNGGLSALWNAMKVETELQGGRFFLSADIASINCSLTEPDKIEQLVLADGSFETYDYVISTIPIDRFLKYLKANTQNESANLQSTIKYRNDRLLYLKVSYEAPVAAQCFYIYSKEISITRVTNFDAFEEFAQSEFSILLIEFWCDKNDEVWNAPLNALLEITAKELDKTNLFKNLKILDVKEKKVENAFQIPDLNFIKNRNTLFEKLSAYDNLYVTGRNAAVNFNYGMENAIMDGITLAGDLSKMVQKNSKMEMI